MRLGPGVRLGAIQCKIGGFQARAGDAHDFRCALFGRMHLGEGLVALDLGVGLVRPGDAELTLGRVALASQACDLGQAGVAVRDEGLAIELAGPVGLLRQRRLRAGFLRVLSFLRGLDLQLRRRRHMGGPRFRPQVGSGQGLPP